MTASVVVAGVTEDVPVDQPTGTKVNFTLNGNLESSAPGELMLYVTQATSSVKSAKGKSVKVVVAKGKVVKQDGKTAKPEALIPGSKVKVKGKFDGKNYYADSVLSRATQFTIVGVVDSVDVDAMTFEFTTTKKSKKLPKGETVVVKYVDGTSQVRVDGTPEYLDAVTEGMKGNVTGYMYMKDDQYMFTAKKVVLKSPK